MKYLEICKAMKCDLWLNDLLKLSPGLRIVRAVNATNYGKFKFGERCSEGAKICFLKHTLSPLLLVSFPNSFFLSLKVKGNQRKSFSQNYLKIQNCYIFHKLVVTMN